MRRAPRDLNIACDYAGLTHFGGIYFFHEFSRVLQFLGCRLPERSPIRRLYAVITQG